MHPKIQRKAGLDLFRIIGVIIVILIHTEQTLPEQIIVDIFGGLVVPVFMIISSFFMFNNFDALTIPERKTKLKKSITSLLLLFLTWKLIYLLFDVFAHTKFNLWGFFIGIFYGGSFGGHSFHLWFFSALILGLITTFHLMTYRKFKAMLVTSVMSFLVFSILSPILQNHGLNTDRLDLSSFVGLIWVPLGALMAHYKSIWQKWNNHFVLLVAVFITLINLLMKYLLNIDINFLTLISAPFLFIYLLDININLKKINLVQLRNVATLVYVLHIIIMYSVKHIGLTQWFTFTVMITFAISIIIVYLGEKFNSKTIKFLYGSK